MAGNKIKPCTHCGECCKSGVPCLLGQMLFNITESNPMACPALEHDNDGFWCGLIRNPVKWFSPLFDGEKWKCEAMGDITRIYIGIGQGCGMGPTQKEVMERMNYLFKSRTKEVVSQ